MGLPNLRGKLRQQVRSHNKIVHRTVELMKLCDVHRVGYALENPDSSMVWKTAAMAPLIAAGHRFSFDFCQFGMPWRKRTGVLTNCKSLCDLEMLCGSASNNYMCTRTQKRHVELSGKDPASGKFRTALACAYPKQFCRKFADLLAVVFE